MSVIGYARVSTVLRSEKRSGSTTEGRDQLQTVLDFIRRGDTLVVTKLDRLARSLADLSRLGWSEGANLVIDVRWGENDPERDRRYAAELVALSPDVTLGVGTLATTALHHATSTLPVVFASVADPVGSDLVDSLARPGGNITGL
jgi:hypothetical protein